MQVIVQHNRTGNETLHTCDNPRCRRPVIVRTGSMFRPLGCNVQIGAKAGDVVMVAGSCPNCNQRYKRPLKDLLLKEAEETPCTQKAGKS